MIYIVYISNFIMKPCKLQNNRTCAFSGGMLYSTKSRLTVDFYTQFSIKIL